MVQTPGPPLPHCVPLHKPLNFSDPYVLILLVRVPQKQPLRQRLGCREFIWELTAGSMKQKADSGKADK